MKKTYTVAVEKDEEGYYVGDVLELPGCHTQARSQDELSERIKEAIELYLEVEEDVRPSTTFFGIQRIEVGADEA
jgi:predicted RNase H-like HicB family nuclease